MTNTEFTKELTTLLNRACRENDSDTPDYLLAEFMIGTLEAYETAVSTPAFEYWKTLGPYPQERPARRQAFRLWARENATKFLELAKQRTPASIREAGP